jgi:hypothetical protein
LRGCTPVRAKPCRETRSTPTPTSSGAASSRRC